MARTGAGPCSLLKLRSMRTVPASANAGAGILALLLLPAVMFGHAAAQSMYTMEAGKDYPGNDIHPSAGPPSVCGDVGYGEDAAACQSRCDRATACVGFVHVADVNCCFLKNTLANPTANARIASYTKILEYEYTVQTGMDYPYNDIRPSDGPTSGVCGFPAYDEDAAACERRCNAAAACAGYVHYADVNCCWIKSALANPTPNGRTVTHSKTGYLQYSIEYGQDYPGNDLHPLAGRAPKNVAVCGEYATQELASACLVRCTQQSNFRISCDDDCNSEFKRTHDQARLDACSKSCAVNPNCVGVAFVPDNSCCYFKGTLGGKNPNARVAFYKNQLS